jgi:hypothetical protein
MQHVFGEHIRPTIEAYIDDIVVKSKRVNNLVDDLDIVSKTISEPMVRLAQTVHPSCTDTYTVFKWIEMGFHMIYVT